MAETSRLSRAPSAQVPASAVMLLRIAIVTTILVAWEGTAASGLLFRDVVPSLAAIGRSLMTLLSDRILVMTYRPGRVKRIVPIELPRPRTSQIVSSEAFGRYVAQIWNDLREEATRGMREDESRALDAGEAAR